MRKLKKAFALLLAATLVLVMLTACGSDAGNGTDGNAIFVHRVNESRAQIKNTLLTRDSALDREAEIFMDAYIKYKDGVWSYQQIEDYTQSNLIHKVGYGDWGSYQVTGAGNYVLTKEEYFGGGYDIDSGSEIQEARGNYIGVYATTHQGKIYVSVVVAAAY